LLLSLPELAGAITMALIDRNFGRHSPRPKAEATRGCFRKPELPSRPP